MVTCSSPRGTGTRPWTIYSQPIATPSPTPAPPTEQPWPQYGGNNQRCGTGCAKTVASQSACQQDAAASGHSYYEYEADRGCCITMVTCSSPRGTGTTPW